MFSISDSNKEQILDRLSQMSDKDVIKELSATAYKLLANNEELRIHPNQDVEFCNMSKIQR